MQLGKWARPSWWLVVLSGLSTFLWPLGSGLLGNAIQQAVGGGLRAVGMTAAVVFVVFGALRLAQVALQGRSPCGFGVVVNLPVENATWSSRRVVAAGEQAERDHVVSESVECVLPGDPQQRRGVLDEVYRRFACEVDKRRSAVASGPVALYLIARLPDAFAFGQRVKYEAHPVTVMQAGERPDGQSAFYAALGLSGQLRSPLTKRERRRAERLVRVEALSWDENPSSGRVALVVALAGSPSTVAAEALKAARTGQSGSYGVRRADRCRAALVVTAVAGSLPERRGVFELVVRYVYERWASWLDGQPGVDEHLVFAAVPASIGLGLGFVFAKSPVRFVEHQPPARDVDAGGHEAQHA